jgi:hypothetical protein
MSLAEIMIEQLSVARRIIEDGHEVVPAWRITTPENAYLILTRFDPDKDGQRERAVHLISRFMTWKMATSFVMTAETWLGAEVTRAGDEALLVIGVSHHERLAALQRIRRGEVVGFSDPMWLAPHHVDENYFAMLPAGRTEVTAEEAHELARIFGEDGEMAAERLG